MLDAMKMMIESSSVVSRRRAKEQLRARRVYKLAGRNWREHAAHEGALERAAECEAAARKHGAHAVRLWRIVRRNFGR
jgi:hypothetical protein